MNKEKIKNFRDNLISTLLSVIVVALVFLIFVFLYWHTHDYKIITWNISHYEMQKEVYKVGEPLTFRTAFCKKGDFEASIVYHIEDGVTYLIPQQVSKSPDGCRDFISSTITTPNLPEGVYKLKGDITYQVNPLRTVTYTMESNKFRIER